MEFPQNNLNRSSGSSEDRNDGTQERLRPTCSHDTCITYIKYLGVHVQTECRYQSNSNSQIHTTLYGNDLNVASGSSNNNVNPGPSLAPDVLPSNNNVNPGPSSVHDFFCSNNIVSPGPSQALDIFRSNNNVNPGPSRAHDYFRSNNIVCPGASRALDVLRPNNIINPGPSSAPELFRSNNIVSPGPSQALDVFRFNNDVNPGPSRAFDLFPYQSPHYNAHEVTNYQPNLNNDIRLSRDNGIIVPWRPRNHDGSQEPRWPSCRNETSISTRFAFDYDESCFVGTNNPRQMYGMRLLFDISKNLSARFWETTPSLHSLVQEIFRERGNSDLFYATDIKCLLAAIINRKLQVQREHAMGLKSTDIVDAINDCIATLETLRRYSRPRSAIVGAQNSYSANVVEDLMAQLAQGWIVTPPRRAPSQQEDNENSST